MNNSTGKLRNSQTTPRSTSKVLSLNIGQRISHPELLLKAFSKDAFLRSILGEKAQIVNSLCCLACLSGVDVARPRL